jgi:glycosyltransferase WbpL
VAWVLLLGVFVFDATVTLVRRVLRGERWYSAHRNHAYQRAVRAGWSHRQVTTGALLFMAALGLLAAEATARPDLVWLCALIALAGLGGCYAWIERVRPMPPSDGS